MNNILFFLMIAAMLAVLISLTAGIVLMAKGNDTNKKYGNKLMQARVYLQGLALALLALTAFVMSGN